MMIAFCNSKEMETVYVYIFGSGTPLPTGIQKNYAFLLSEILR